MPNTTASSAARSSAWTADRIPDQTGRIAVVTGGNSGLGYEGALALAARGAHVVLACRSAEKAKEATERIRGEVSGASLEFRPLDLASLESVRRFASDYAEDHDRLDLLCNNAGVMALPRCETADGFEMQLGTNHLGHFALTGLLLPVLLKTAGARVVTTSSSAHRVGRMRFDDLQGEKSYFRWSAYGQSKLANLLFAYELERRLRAARADVRSLACHPGYAATNLQTAGPRMDGSSWMERLMELGNRLFAQSAAVGALPMLYAATAPDAEGGSYIGPDGFGEMWGYPRRVDSTARARDEEAAQRLWDVSETLTGVRYDALAA
ncbi:MAG: oxidoreductase [Proteobacteria bacterium]|nr:oxidoreductase [Pseudomonadota bacterium]